MSGRSKARKARQEKPRKREKQKRRKGGGGGEERRRSKAPQNLFFYQTKSVYFGPKKGCHVLPPRVVLGPPIICPPIRK